MKTHSSSRRGQSRHGATASASSGGNGSGGTRVAIIGTGAYAQALGARFSSVGVQVIYGSRSAEVPPSSSSPSSHDQLPCVQLHQQCPLMLHGCPVQNPCAAVATADVVVFAIPISAHSAMVDCIRRAISGRDVVLIDVSNSPLESKGPSSWFDWNSWCTKKKKKENNMKQDKKKKKEKERKQKKQNKLEKSLQQQSATTATITAESTPATFREGYVPLPTGIDLESALSAPVMSEHGHDHCAGCKAGCLHGSTSTTFQASSASSIARSSGGGNAIATTTATATATAPVDIEDLVGADFRSPILKRSQQNLSSRPSTPRDAVEPTRKMKMRDNAVDDLEACYHEIDNRKERPDDESDDEDDEEETDVDEVEEDEDEETAGLSNAERLQRLMPDVAVVKAFNTVSAYALKSGIGARLDDRVLICGDRPGAKELVARLVYAIGMRPVDAGPLAVAREIEKRPLELFVEWRTAFWLSLILLIFAYGYVAIRDVWLGAKPGEAPRWHDLLMLKFNLIIAWHAMALLTLTFGAGVVAAFRQLATGTMKRAFPLWLDSWLRARKALGLLGVTSLALHAVASMVNNSLFIDWNYVEAQRSGAEYQGSLLAALLAAAVYAALAITSLPSVAASLSWREWDFIQSKLGHVGLALASIHVLLMSFALGALPDVSHWAHRYWLPPQSVLAVAPAILVLVLRLLICIPPLSTRLARIRGLVSPPPAAKTKERKKKKVRTKFDSAGFTSVTIDERVQIN